MEEYQMKRWKVITIFTATIILIGLGVFIAVRASVPSGIAYDPSDAGYCEQYGIEIDGSSVEMIFQHPEMVLADPEAFLGSDTATLVFYKLHAEWNTPLNVKRWTRQIEKISGLPEGKKEQESTYKFAREVAAGQETWCKIAVPHVLSYLPGGTDLNTTVYLLAFDPLVSGQGVWGRIVMSLSHPLYVNAESFFNRGTTSVLNILTHELFHVGYSNVKLNQSEITLASSAEQALLVALQNEGMAVRTAYTLREYYPCPLETVYLSHQCKPCVRYMIGRVNRIFDKAGSISEAKSYKKIRRLYNNSAVYMVGGYMAEMIEEHLGKEALVNTLEIGPRAFVQAYNSIAEQGLEIHYETPDEYPDNIYTELHSKAIEQNYSGIRESLGAIRSSNQPVDLETDGYLIYKSGYALLDQDQLDLAEETFKLLTEYFPETASLHIGLGDVCVKKGEISQAIDYYQRAVELEPRQQWLKVVIRELEDK
jgi:tetratricopeptide (TPR) repeat protein